MLVVILRAIVHAPSPDIDSSATREIMGSPVTSRSSSGTRVSTWSPKVSWILAR